MALIEMEYSDVVFLQKAAQVMRQGRAAELIGEVWPRGLEELGAKIAWQVSLEKANAHEVDRKVRAERNHTYAKGK